MECTPILVLYLFPAGKIVLVGKVLALQVVYGVVTLLWISLGLVEDGKHVVPFPSGEQEHVGRVGSLLWVSLGLREDSGSISPVEIGGMVENSALCDASIITT